MFSKNKVACLITATACGAGLLFSQIGHTQNGFNTCNTQSLTALMDADFTAMDQREMHMALGNELNDAEINAYYDGEALKAVTTFFQEDGSMAEMNFYFMADKENNHLMEYRNTQYSNYLNEEDSVVITDSTSYYHVCAGELLTPAFDGIIDNDTYQKINVILNLILTEEAAR